MHRRLRRRWDLWLLSCRCLHTLLGLSVWFLTLLSSVS